MREDQASLNIVLWFAHEPLNVSVEKILERAVPGLAKAGVHLALFRPKISDRPDGRRELDALKELADHGRERDTWWVWTDVAFDPATHIGSITVGEDENESSLYFVDKIRSVRFVCFIWDREQSYFGLAERQRWRSRPISISLPVSLRCPARVVSEFRPEGLEAVDLKKMVEHLALSSLSCPGRCRASQDPIQVRQYRNWDILLLDDQVLHGRILKMPDESDGLDNSEGFKSPGGPQQQELSYTIKGLGGALNSQHHLRGRWYVGGTEEACQLVCLDGEVALTSARVPNDSDTVKEHACSEAHFPPLRDPLYGFDNYDLILLDVLFDLKIAADIQFVPRIRAATGSPLFVLSSAGKYGGHGESALYYANRALRFGATGYLDKVDDPGEAGKSQEDDKFERMTRMIQLSVDYEQWEREWEERFERSADDFLGGADSELSKLLTEMAGEEESQRASSGDGETLRKFKYILCKLFEGYDRVVLDARVSAGVGAGRKFFVTAEKNGREDNPKLVKLGGWDDLRSEAANYRECIAGYLDTFVGQISREPVRAGRHMGVTYGAVGYARDEYGKTPSLSLLSEVILESCMEHATYDQVESYLNELNGCLLSRLYRERGRLTPQMLDGRQGRPRPEDQAYEADAVRHFVDRCGIATIGELWRKEYARVLPPVFEYESLVPCNVRSSPCPSPVANSPADERNAVSGRIWSWSKTEDEDVGWWKITFDLIRTDLHKRIRVMYRSSEPVWDSMILNPGKHVVIETANGCSFHKRSLLDSLHGQLESALRCETASKTVAPIYEDILDGEFTLAEIPLGRMRALDVFENLLTKMGYYSEEERPCGLQLPMILSTVHGDLNLGNILVGQNPARPEHRDYWLIDFEATHLRGHLAFDFAKLETEIRSEIVPRLLLDDAVRWMQDARGSRSSRAARARERAVSILYSMETALESNQRLSEAPKALQVAYRWISGIRRLAASYKITPDELRLSTFLYAVRTIGFSKLSDPSKLLTAPFPKVVQFVAAGVMASEVVAILERQRQ
jgi:hypothetical protein